MMTVQNKEELDARLMARLNILWLPIYPYMGEWIRQWCPEKTGRVLETGPFSGGISSALTRVVPDLRTVSLMSQDAVARTTKAQFKPNLETIIGSLESLPFGPTFDTVIFRGAFFFLTPQMIKEAYRVLKPGACALLGGGYGPLTPEKEIKKIAEESKKLNYQLGKKWISRENLEQMVVEAGSEEYSQILEEGGLWLLLRKEFSFQL